jgi:Arc/MetJ-type ribon-helix-helix transcriptional regulator
MRDCGRRLIEACAPHLNQGICFTNDSEYIRDMIRRDQSRNAENKGIRARARSVARVASCLSPPHGLRSLDEENGQCP